MRLPPLPIGFVLTALLLAAAWLVADQFPPWNSLRAELCAGLALLAAALTVWSQTPMRRRGVPGLALLLAGVALLPWAQWLGGVLHFSGDAWVSSLYLGGLAVAVAVGFQAAAPDDAARSDLALMLAVATLVGGAATAAIALAQGFDVDSFGTLANAIQKGDRARGNLGQPNNAATLIGWALVALLYLRERRVIGTVGAAGLALFLVVGLAPTQSRTALLFGPVLVAGWWAAGRRLPQLTRLRVLVILWLLAVVAMTLWPTLQQNLGAPSGLSLADRGAQTGRLVIWPRLLEAVNLQPLTGYGWLQAGDAYTRVAPNYPNTGELWFNSHNLLLELLVWTGWPLGLALCGLLLGWFGSRWFAVLKRPSLDAVTGMLVLSVMGVHAMLELPEQYAYFLIPAGLWVGIVEARRGARGVLGWLWLAAAQATLVAVTVALLWHYPEVEEDFRLVRFENLNIGDLKATQPAPDAPLLSTLTEFLRLQRTPLRAGLSDAELAGMKAITQRYPYAPSLYRTSVALALNGRPEEAAAYWNLLYRMHDEKFYRLSKDALVIKAEQGDPGIVALLKQAP